jgi:Ca-activated chloride channel family protein
MKGEKMDQARAAMRYCVDHLHAEDRFEVIRFSTEAESVFGEMVPADANHRDRARKFLDEVSAVGGTAIEEALALAMRTAAAKTEAGRPARDHGGDAAVEFHPGLSYVVMNLSFV